MYSCSCLGAYSAQVGSNEHRTTVSKHVLRVTGSQERREARVCKSPEELHLPALVCVPESRRSSNVPRSRPTPTKTRQRRADSWRAVRSKLMSHEAFHRHVVAVGPAACQAVWAGFGVRTGRRGYFHPGLQLRLHVKAHTHRRSLVMTSQQLSNPQHSHARAAASLYGCLHECEISGRPASATHRN